MGWEVDCTDEFGAWWSDLEEVEQDSIAMTVSLLESDGPNLSFPHTSGIERSRHSHMRELRIQHKGEPYRTLYAFDPRRGAILLIGGNKAGLDRWYNEFVPIAEKLYDQHLETLKKEGLIDG